jgi:hypothetical protein
MTGRAALLLVVACFAWSAGFVAVAAGTARADTAATCTTDTATSYCEQLPTGSNDGAAQDGFVLVEATLGVLMSLLVGFFVLRKIFAAAGLGSW